MSIWTSNVQKSTTDAAESLSYAPSGGRLKMWLAGVGMALIPLGYGVRRLLIGQARFLGSRGHLDLVGPAATALAIAYIAVGAFIHFHYFWGLHPRLLRLSPALKIVAVLVFLGSFGYTMYRIIA